MGEVFVVDSQVSVNSVPPKQRIKGTYVLYTLLGLALFGVLVEGALIYQLYQRIPTQTSPEAVRAQKRLGENKTRDDADSDAVSPIPKTDSDNKPAVFLNYMHSTQNSDKIQWDNQGYPALLDGFNYSNGNLIILKEGFYYLFSKVSFINNCSLFKHEIILSSLRYNSKNISLVTDSRYNCASQMKPPEKKSQFSSYLGGVWKLYKNDKVFVLVSNHSNLIRLIRTENIFGGFMV